MVRSEREGLVQHDRKGHHQVLGPPPDSTQTWCRQHRGLVLRVSVGPTPDSTLLPDSMKMCCQRHHGHEQEHCLSASSPRIVGLPPSLDLT